jgi:serine/threonine protein kinase/tetratricopeptide (TPR) repeat protein
MKDNAMQAERWRCVEQLYHSAMEQAEGEREAFLERSCAGDQALRAEVESLIAYAGQTGQIIDKPALELVVAAMAEDLRARDGNQTGKMISTGLTQYRIAGKALTSGTKLGEYEVKSLLGSGSMGEVYRAHDSRLGRDVAIKILPSFFSADSDRLRRFEQEARAAAALNHPNILAVFQMGTCEGAPYLVSELLEGETLREQIKRGALPVRKVIDYAVQIARGLAAAHEKGIVHRDLKPENLFVTKDGRVKILDFGLAKLTQPQSSSEHSALTLTEGTEAGVVMGTVGYMAPEQVRGQTADQRADIFAFGAILYEMLAGKRAFQKPTSPETMTAILNEDPPGISQVTTNLPPALQRVVHRCLEKNPEQRFQSASDLAFALDALPDSGSAHWGMAAKAATAVAKRWTAIVPAVAAVLAIAVGGYVYFHRTTKLTDKDTIVLDDFTNSTGDAIFDDTLKTALNVSLRQSPFLNVLPDSEVAKTLQLMTRPVDTKLTPEIARELCLRAGSKVYIGGAIGSLGSEYVLGLKAMSCRNGDVLAEEQVTAASKEKVLDALGGAASKLRGELGESLASLQKFDVPLEQATTSSLGALQAYTLGRRVRNEKGDATALPYFQRAVGADPNFAMAYRALGGVYDGLNQPGQGMDYLTKAFQLREHASEREKLTVTADYYEFVTGELDKATQTFQELIESYPRDPTANDDLGEAFALLGQYEKAAEVTRRGIRLDPARVALFENLTLYTLALQRFDEARRIVHELQARKVDDAYLHTDIYVLAFRGADSAAMAEQRQWFAGKPEERFGLALAADAEAYGGHLGNARELTNRAVHSAILADSKEGGAIWQANAALRQAAYGNPAEARRSAAAALKLAPASQGVEIETALAFAMAGGTARAESLARDLGKRFPLSTQIQSLWLPAIQAQLALDRKVPASAVNAPQYAPSIELGLIPFVDNISCLYPVYVRGEAYLAAGQGNAAAAEFQKILDHTGIVWNCWTGALARLGVARANALEVKTSQGADAAARVRALTAYKDFLTLWKDADPDIPVLKQAKAEYAQLQLVCCYRVFPKF